MSDSVRLGLILFFVWTIMGLIFTQFAKAEHVFQRYSSEYWVINGYQEGNEMSCVISTNFLDGSKININVFPRRDGTQYTTMTLTRPSWDLSPYYNGQKAEGVEVMFYGNNFPPTLLTGEAQKYNDKKLIFRKLSDEFSNLWINGTMMVLFPETDQEWKVSLHGTLQASYDLTDCINTVKNTKF